MFFRWFHILSYKEPSFYTVVGFFYVGSGYKILFIALILFVSFLIAVALDVQSRHRGPVLLKALFVLE